MTPQEQIAYLRSQVTWNTNGPAIIAVCDLAERALNIDAEVTARLTDTERAGWDVAQRMADHYRLTDDEAEAVRQWLEHHGNTRLYWPSVDAVLRRLLPDERVEHRLEPCGREVVLAEIEGCAAHVVWCSRTAGPCPYPGALNRRVVHEDYRVCAAAHAGIGGTE